ncbi:MAG: amino acid ABC transporter permease [Proteobacteria bacterium]|nr:amino acid ABC transporter permease [Pseudomonadota bacterium]
MATASRTDKSFQPGKSAAHPMVLAAWLRRRYFRTPLNSAISLLGMAFLLFLAYHALQWAVVQAVWISPDGTSAVCRGISGACWAVIQQRWRIIIFGLFPYDEQWRSMFACLVMVATIILSCVPFFWKPLRLSLLWSGGFLLFYALMRGGVFGMPLVQPADWGGLTLTVFLYAAGVLIGMPMAIAMALARRSEMPLVSKMTGGLIDGVRSLPLITILFTAALIFPFVLPGWLQGDKIWRVIIGFALFFAAYQAEIIRSGLQSIPVGQEEAAKALGLTYWQRTSRIMLPQAFRNALPPTINQLVITFKETSLIVIIGFFEILASGNAAYGTGEWSFAYFEVYIFVALVYFAFVFSLSRYGAYLERRMRFGQH